jgi:lipoate-protein ligase A
MLEALNVYDDLEPRPAALNMAIDEALLNCSLVPVLRFYRWQRPAASFGYFGCYAEVKSQSDGREIVRRWTGGGIVPHGDDLTYSLIVPASDPLFARSSSEIYSEVHEAIRRTLQSNGISASLADSPAPKVSDDCFANAVRADVLSDGRKIAGAAHRRSRAGLLHQGSIQWNLPSRFKEDLARLLCERFELKTISPDTIEHAVRIAETKYGTPEWLMRR